ncbi:MAG: hypothetical protein E7453_07890 [Ruminococcaceae bacterium]|nr:hypothetical protein [Oscillospiraceae bacterium]
MTEEMVKKEEEIAEACAPAKNLEQLILEIGVATELPSLAEKTFVLAEVKNAEALKERIAQEGGQVKETTVLATDYLILGDSSKGETAKAKRALELNQTRGKNIQAMKESDFWRLLEERDAKTEEEQKRLAEEAEEKARELELARIAEEERLRKEAEEQKRLEEEAAAKARELELARIAMEERLRREAEEKKRREEFAEAMRLYELAREEWVAAKIAVEDQRNQALQEARIVLRSALKEEIHQWYLDAMQELSVKTTAARKNLVAAEEAMSKLNSLRLIQRAKYRRIINEAEKVWNAMPEEAKRIRAQYQKKKKDFERTLQSREEQLIAELEIKFPIPPAPQKPQ